MVGSESDDEAEVEDDGFGDSESEEGEGSGMTDCLADRGTSTFFPLLRGPYFVAVVAAGSARRRILPGRVVSIDELFEPIRAKES